MVVIRQIGYARVTVATAETTHRVPGEDFWTRCDDLFDARGALRRAYAQFVAGRHERARRRARGDQAKRDARIATWPQSSTHLPTARTHVPDTDTPRPLDTTDQPARGYDDDVDRAGSAGVQTRRAAGLAAEVSPITAQFRLLYHHLPSADMLPAVTGHLRLLDRLLHRASDDVRRRLASEVAETAGLAAWLCGEADDGIGMLRLYRLADDAADLSGERALAGYIRGFSVQTLVGRGEVLHGLAEFDAARALTGRGQPTVAAWLAALHANALASAARRADALAGWTMPSGSSTEATRWRQPSGCTGSTQPGWPPTGEGACCGWATPAAQGLRWSKRLRSCRLDASGDAPKRRWTWPGCDCSRAMPRRPPA